MSNVYISWAAPNELVRYLKDEGHRVKKVYPMGRTYMPVDCHPDIFMCKMGLSDSSEIIMAELSEIGEKYPKNIRYNAVCTDKFFMHSLKYTSSVLLEKAKSMELRLIDVKQGYTKCNTVIVDNNSLITSDPSVYSEASKNGLEVLKISNGYVNLDGFDYGFLGGASGIVGNKIVFCGDLSSHPDYEKIYDFISNRGVEIKYFKSFPLTDIGSIIEE